MATIGELISDCWKECIGVHVVQIVDYLPQHTSKYSITKKKDNKHQQINYY
jgi:hypothetical protein